MEFWLIGTMLFGSCYGIYIVGRIVLMLLEDLIREKKENKDG